MGERFLTPSRPVSLQENEPLLAPGKYYPLVPKDPGENLRWRREILQAGASDDKTAAELWMMCARDLHFWINAVCWTYDPRLSPEPTVIPFITWPMQDEALAEMEEVFGQEDMISNKSRDEGASWMAAALFQHRWQFFDMQSFLMVSRVQDLVDKKGDPDALFWKFLFLVDRQPGWLRPAFRRVELHVENTENGSVLDGAATTGDVSAGGRRTAVLFDEFARVPVDDQYKILTASRDVTRCRFFNSSVQGTGNGYADMLQGGKIKVIELPWWRDPRKNKGLYIPGVIPQVLDRDYVYPVGWTFQDHDEFTAGGCQSYVDMGRPRSPWFDHECERVASPREIAQEVNMGLAASDYQYFEEAVLARVEKEFCLLPFKTGELNFNGETHEPEHFQSEPNGPLRLWCDLDAWGNPPEDREFVIGIDISVGSGATPTVMAIYDKLTGEQVGEWANSHVKPHNLPPFAISLGRWFHGSRTDGALIIWETNGPGADFGPELLDLGYNHIYWRENLGNRKRKVSSTPGWGSTKTTKELLLGNFRLMQQKSYLAVRSKTAIAEQRAYKHLATGQIVHARSLATQDPTGARENHGDHVIAHALAAWTMKDLKKKSAVAAQQSPTYPVGSLGWRQEQYAKGEHHGPNGAFSRYSRRKPPRWGHR